MELLLQTSRRRPLLLPALLLAAATTAVYAQSLSFPFLPYDDDLYVTANPAVRQGLSPDSVRWAFRTFHASNWHPLTWLSHMADVELFGLDAGKHHAVNALLHCANALLLLFALHRLTGAVWRSALAAALFALHPLHVESVAWVAERKDVLSGLFFLLALLAYGRYAEAPGRPRMAATALFFALALLAKPSAVPFPFALLLLDYWPLRRLAPPGEGREGRAAFLRNLAALAAEKAPLFLLSAASCAVTLAAQRAGGSLAGAGLAPPGDRLLNAFASYAAYLGKTLVPAGLSAYYPYPLSGPSLPAGLAGAALVAAASAAAVRYGRRFPWLPFGWFWYLGTLVPMIGIVQAGGQAMADRYTYLPLAGIFVAAAWGAGEVAAAAPRLRRPAAAAAAALLLPLGAAAHRQASLWGDSESLFRQAVANTRDNWFAMACLAYGLDAKGRGDEAAAWLREVVRLRPGHLLAHYNLGAVLLRAGRLDEAYSRFRDAALLNPGYVEAHLGMSAVRAAQGRPEEAIPPLLEALRLAPGNADALVALGEAEASLGRKEEAAGRFREALSLRPGDEGAGRGLAALGLPAPFPGAGPVSGGGSGRRGGEARPLRSSAPRGVAPPPRGGR